MTLTLTTDELRVAATLSGGGLPVLLDGGWSTEDVPVADIVALRGLLARGLATARDLEVSLTGEAAAIAALADPRTVIDVRRDGTERAGRWLVAERDGTVVSCVESRPDLWSFGPLDADRLSGDLVDALPEAESDADPLRVRTDLLVRADRHPDAAYDTLIGHGVERSTAERLARLLADVRLMTTVSRMHRAGTIRDAVAVTWLETAESGAWLAVPVADEVHPEAPEPAPCIELRTTCRAEIRVLVADVLDGVR